MGEGRERLADVFELAERDPSASGARKRAFAAPVWIAIGVVPKTDDEGKLVMDADEEMMAVACAVQNLHLMATSLGLAGMWHSKGLSTDPNVEKALGLTAPAKLLGFFMCGWPASDTPVGERGPWQDKVVWHEQGSPKG